MATSHVRMHNEFDQEVVVCCYCYDLVNEGITDDRERFHSPRGDVHGESCHYCGN